MVVDDGAAHHQRVAEAVHAIRGDFVGSGREPPREALLRRAADIVATYPEAWPRYTAAPDDWDGRFAVAILSTWRAMKAELAAPQAEAA